MEEEIKKAALELVSGTPIVMLGNNGPDGYPGIKAMIKMENEGLRTFWFSTNTSSKRVGQLRKDGKACVYLVDMKSWRGLMLLGEVEVLEDPAAKRRLWRDGFEKYYPKGVTDPDYCVLRFTALRGNYYHNLHNSDFAID